MFHQRCFLLACFVVFAIVVVAMIIIMVVATTPAPTPAPAPASPVSGTTAAPSSTSPPSSSNTTSDDSTTILIIVICFFMIGVCVCGVLWLISYSRRNRDDVGDGFPRDTAQPVTPFGRGAPTSQQDAYVRDGYPQAGGYAYGGQPRSMVSPAYGGSYGGNYGGSYPQPSPPTRAVAFNRGPYADAGDEMVMVCADCMLPINEPATPQRCARTGKLHFA
jgi:hypothetical protein